MKEQIKEYVEEADDKVKAVNEIKEELYKVSPVKDNPIDCVKWVKLDKVRANDYNPNTVADEEMELLFKSIREDGYTQPIVTVYHEDEDEYEIVDGFHRYRVMKKYDEISDRSYGRLPITVIDKSMQERMASTVRHNRASGTHGVQGMSEVVRGMKEEGMSDEEICEELGMEAEELDEHYEDLTEAKQESQVDVPCPHCGGSIKIDKNEFKRRHLDEDEY